MEVVDDAGVEADVGVDDERAGEDGVEDRVGGGGHGERGETSERA